MQYRRFIVAIVSICTAALSLSAQAVAPPTVAEIVRRAAEQRSVYVDTFKNLLSEETKTFEIYSRDGDVKKRRVVRSTFIVYQSAKDEAKITEYRNVDSVDGKTLGQTDARAQDFFTNVSKAESSASELEKIREESLRFDEEIAISDLTLFQAIALADGLRQSFDFTLTGKESLDGRSVYVVDYRQASATQNISVGSPSAAGNAGVNYDVDLHGLKDVNERLNGKLWVDAETFQIVREQRVLSIQPAGFEARVPISENVFEFQRSDVGILAPRRISHLQFEIDKKRRTSFKDVQVVFEYGKFTRPDVEVKSSEVSNKPE